MAWLASDAGRRVRANDTSAGGILRVLRDHGLHGLVRYPTGPASTARYGAARTGVDPERSGRSLIAGRDALRGSREP